MLDGVTPFPAEFAATYRATGYWQDRPLFDGFRRRWASTPAGWRWWIRGGPVTYRRAGRAVRAAGAGAA